tara:strand:+ start:5624 stop:6613 length:990 start_codon:yes stop_codon:yes gene_type:complete
MGATHDFSIPVVQVTDLRTYFYGDEGIARAVDGVSFTINKGETLGLVGESGCGKSVTALSLMGLITGSSGRIENGTIEVNGRDIVPFSESEMCDIRGDEVAMIFQEPMSSLNPVLTCGYQIMEAVMLHQGVGKVEARARAIEMLKRVGIPAPEQRIDEYPHQLSGGMRQRVMIAMALSCNPDLLIADEPTTALDVTVQAQILDLLEDLQRELEMAILLITHDLGVVAEIADQVAVMYAGKIVETATMERLFTHPRHPYTQGLLRSMPKLEGERKRLEIIPGNVPDVHEIPTGCNFNPRCQLAEDICRNDQPELTEVASGQWASCWKANA